MTLVEMPPFAEWATFKSRMGWKQAEHLTVIGRTGSGKTVLTLDLLSLRQYVVILATKPRDSTMTQMRKRGYRIVRDWPVIPEINPRVIFWPKISTMSDQEMQSYEIGKCLESIYETGGWTVCIDEIRYIADPAYLGLRSHLQALWTQGRSNKITVVGGSQRPAWVPPEAYSQATHLFFFQENDDVNLKRVASMGGMQSKRLREIVPRLAQHEALYVNTLTGAMVRTMVPSQYAETFESGREVISA